MAHFNNREQITSQKSRSIGGNARPKLKILATSVSLVAVLTAATGVAADERNLAPPEAENSVTVEQQQKLVEWSLRAHADLSKNLDVKLQAELTSMLDPSGRFQDIPSPVIELPEQQLVCRAKPGSDKSEDVTSSRDCYAASSR